MINIGIYIYDNAEVLDFSGPFEVFTTATRVLGEDFFNTFLVNEQNELVKARANYKVVPDYQFTNHPKIDVLIVVGGDHREEVNKTNVSQWLLKQSKAAKLIASVCTGVFLLAKAGVVTTHEVTTHWDDIYDLKVQYPKLKIKEGVRWVEQNNIITSGGISAGIDMCLHLISQLHSETLAVATAKQMDFNWSR